jgi:Sulfatase
VNRRQAPPLRSAGLHLLVLWSFAVAQPLFDLLGKNGEFFAARGSTRWDVVVFALVVLFLPPALMTAFEASFSGELRGAVHLVLVAALAGLFVLQAIRRIGAPGWLLVALAGVGGLALAVLYRRVAGARLVVTVLGPAPLLFLGLFLLGSDASRLTLSATDAALAAGKRPRAPVVLVAFDELPLNSLLDSRERIDPVRFPNFARLARGSTWFASTTTVAEGTTHAVPTILTGRYPRPDELPVYTDHRQNLFTLLGGAADLHVLDDETHLCPPRLCPGLEGSFGGRMATLAEDTGVVYLHQLLPDDLTGGIPSIANGWANFLRDASPHHDPGRVPPAFLRSLRPQRRPALWYVHFMLPHSPWNYLPSGRRYAVRSAPGWGPDEVWSDDQASVDQHWQRHMLQLAYTDRVLGRLLARLRAAGLYDRALLVATADHGVSFRAGEKRRPLSPANLEDIAYVPLFVKQPGQRRGRVVREPARTIDILPTLAEALGVRLPWHVDGRPLLPAGARPPERNVVLIKDHGRRFVVPTARLEARRRSALRRQLRLFGSHEPVATLFALGPDRRLLGRRLERGTPVRDLDPVDRSGPLVQVSGHVAAGARSVAVVAGDRVVAVVPALGGRFWAIVPRAELRGQEPRAFAVGP